MLARQVPQWLSVVIAFLLLSACATMFYGTTQEVPVTSVPDGAEVRIQGKLIGNTPVTITLDRKPDHELEISKPAPSPACVPRPFPVLFVRAAPWSGPMDRLVLADPILRPTRAPPLLSCQIQQRPGHPPGRCPEHLRAHVMSSTDHRDEYAIG